MAAPSVIPGEIRGRFLSRMEYRDFHRSQNEFYQYGSFAENPELSTNCKAPVYGGDSACPPEPPLRFYDCVVLPPLEFSRRGGATAVGAEALHAVAPDER